MKDTMKRTRFCIIAGSVLGSLVYAQDVMPQDEDIFELSPFTVQADSDIGYMATNTLAGSRLNTQLRDVASAVSVITAEVFADTGATDAETILSYALNTETGGLQGNFAGAGFDGGNNRTDNDDSRVNPQGNQRIRGLGSATLTRNFLLTEIPFDSYNSSRAEINRGPNAILFGLGTPGGIINNTTNAAEVGSSFGDVTVRFGDHNSHRATFDLNQVVIDGRLAVRLDGLYDDTKYQQDPAFKRDKRIYGALKGVLFENDRTTWLGPTIVRANFESGDITSNPPSVLPPNNIYHSWWECLKVDYEKYTGVAPFDRLLPPNFVPKFKANTLVDRSVPDMNTVADIPNFIQVALVHPDPSAGPMSGFSAQFPSAQGFQARLNDFDPDTPGNQLFDMFFTRSPELEIYAAGFITPSIQDRKVFDYRNKLFSGGMDRLTQDFNAANVTLEQTFFDDKRAGVEVAYDTQDWSRWSRLVVNSEVAAVFGNNARVPRIKSSLSDRIFRLRKENPHEKDEKNDRTDYPHSSRQRRAECG